MRINVDKKKIFGTQKLPALEEAMGMDPSDPQREKRIAELDLFEDGQSLDLLMNVIEANDGIESALGRLSSDQLQQVFVFMERAVSSGAASLPEVVKNHAEIIVQSIRNLVQDIGTFSDQSAMVLSAITQETVLFDHILDLYRESKDGQFAFLEKVMGGEDQALFAEVGALYNAAYFALNTIPSDEFVAYLVEKKTADRVLNTAIQTAQQELSREVDIRAFSQEPGVVLRKLRNAYEARCMVALSTNEVFEHIASLYEGFSRRSNRTPSAAPAQGESNALVARWKKNKRGES